MSSKNKNIVLLHGWGASTEKLKPLQKNLIQLGWKVLIPSIPGFDAPPPKTVWGVEEYANHLMQLANNFFQTSNFFIFGHSFGGRIAVKIASQPIKNIRGVILCATSGFSRPPWVKRIFFQAMAKLGKILLIVPPVARLWKKIIYKLSREHDYEKTKGIMREIFKKVIRENQRPEVIKIKLPTLILWGTNDRVTPVKDAFYLQKKIRKSKLITYSAEDHRLPYNKATHLAQQIEKWSNTIN